MRWLKTFRRTVLIAGLFLTFGCTTTSQRQTLRPFARQAPQWNLETETAAQVHQRLQAHLKNKADKPVKWWVQYNQARLWAPLAPQTACQLFHQLSHEKSFPLHNIALLRAHETCAKNSLSLAPLPLEEMISTPWLKQTAVTTGIVLAERDGNELQAMKLYIENSKISTHRPTKVEWTQKALKTAKKHLLKKEMAQYKKRLYWLSPRFKPNPQRSELLKTAHDFRRERQFQRARKIYMKIIADSKSQPGEIYQALQGIRRSYKLERQMKKYVRATYTLAKYAYKLFRTNEKKYTELYHDTITLYARTLWTDGQVKATTRLLNGLANDLKGRRRLEHIHWIRGRMEEEKKNYHLAINWFNHALRECRNTCALHKKIQWYKAWNLLKLGQNHHAIQLLTTLYQQTQEVKKPKILFWWAKTLKTTGQTRRANEKFQKLIEIDPIGYYGILSHRELGKKFPAPKTVRTPASLSNSKNQKIFSHSDDSHTISWLLAVGETQLAANFLNQIAKKFAKSHPTHISLWIEILNFYARSGDYIGLFRHLGQRPPHVRRTLLSLQPDIIFPRPYLSVVQQSARRFGVSSELIYSIMRQESAFNHKARSPADAFGLMQLIPSVAKHASQLSNVNFKEPNDLYIPQVNIPLGSAYLRKLWEKYNGQFVLLTASYNASEKAIRNWVRHRFNGDPLQFIEDIPYKETRDYIKLVLRNLVFYQRLNSGGRALGFPEWCLKNIQAVNI